MKTCSVCKKTSSTILMNNRFVCFRCDELLFDIEIESDEVEIVLAQKSERQKVKPEIGSTKTDRQK